MKKNLPYVSDEEEDLRSFRKDPKQAEAYLNACIEVAFEENDPQLVLLALAKVAKAQKMTRVAKAVAVKRESLHRMLSKRGNPEWNSLFRVLKALHLRPRLDYTPTKLDKIERLGKARGGKSSKNGRGTKTYRRSSLLAGVSARNRHPAVEFGVAGREKL